MKISGRSCTPAPFGPMVSVVLIGLLTMTAQLNLFSQGKNIDVSGVWELDLKKSENLPASFGKVESYTSVIVQKNDTLTVNAGMKGSGQTIAFPPFIYVVNGIEQYRRDTLRGSERWTTSRWSKAGDSILMDIRILLTQTGREASDITQHDVWKLIGANTLEISTTQRASGSDTSRIERRLYRKMK